MNKILYTILLISVFFTGILYADTSKTFDYQSVTKKYGEKDGINIVLDKMVDIFSDGNPKYKFEIKDQGWYGLLGLSNYIIDSVPFMKGKTIEDLMDPDTNIKIGAYMLKECIKTHGKTPMAIRCFSELIAKDGAVDMAKEFN